MLILRIKIVFCVLIAAVTRVKLCLSIHIWLHPCFLLFHVNCWSRLLKRQKLNRNIDGTEEETFLVSVCFVPEPQCWIIRLCYSYSVFRSYNCTSIVLMWCFRRTQPLLLTDVLAVSIARLSRLAWCWEVCPPLRAHSEDSWVALRLLPRCRLHVALLRLTLIWATACVYRTCNVMCMFVTSWVHVRRLKTVGLVHFVHWDLLFWKIIQ